mmetsp:Transcript_4889/g.16398  ORF Transcript_4889/g.16398 Transcript_4889/m.16398 type:complete len:229 (+) Transcript_4889:281-967(+)
MTVAHSTVLLTPIIAKPNPLVSTMARAASAAVTPSAQRSRARSVMDSSRGPASHARSPYVYASERRHAGTEHAISDMATISRPRYMTRCPLRYVLPSAHSAAPPALRCGAGLCVGIHQPRPRASMPMWLRYCTNTSTSMCTKLPTYVKSAWAQHCAGLCRRSAARSYASMGPTEQKSVTWSAKSPAAPTAAASTLLRSLDVSLAPALSGAMSTRRATASRSSGRLQPT